MPPVANHPSHMLPIVGVMGSGQQAWQKRSRELGILLAGLGVHLLTGGGEGVMKAVSRAFQSVVDRNGLVIGVLPGDAAGARPPGGYPNPWVEIVIQTHLPLSGTRGCEPLSRNHINVLSSDLVIALPGGPGTLSEVELALQYKKPVVAWLDSLEDLQGLPDTVPIYATRDRLASWIRAVLDDRPHPETGG